MYILIIGNLYSGKSILGMRLAHKLGINHLSIDDMRVTFSDGSKEGEKKAWEEYLWVLENSPKGIFEFSGVGQYAERVKKIIDQKKGRVLMLNTPVETCIARHRQLPKKVPIPYKTNKITVIKRLNEELKDNIFNPEMVDCDHTEQYVQEFLGDYHEPN